MKQIVLSCISPKENEASMCIYSFAGANGHSYLHEMYCRLLAGYRVQGSCNKIIPLLVAAANCIYQDVTSVT